MGAGGLILQRSPRYELGHDKVRGADAAKRRRPVLLPYSHGLIWLDTGEPTQLDQLLAAGPVLLFFYLFDWSPT